MSYAEGEDERVLRAVQAIVEEGLAKPILIGRPNVIETRLKRFGLAISPAATSSSSTPTTIRATAPTSRPTSISPDAAASRRTAPARWCAPTTR